MNKLQYSIELEQCHITLLNCKFKGKNDIIMEKSTNCVVRYFFHISLELPETQWRSENENNIIYNFDLKF